MKTFCETGGGQVHCLSDSLTRKEDGEGGLRQIDELRLQAAVWSGPISHPGTERGGPASIICVRC